MINLDEFHSLGSAPSSKWAKACSILYVLFAIYSGIESFVSVVLVTWLSTFIELDTGFSFSLDVFVSYFLLSTLFHLLVNFLAHFCIFSEIFHFKIWAFSVLLIVK